MKKYLITAILLFSFIFVPNLKAEKFNNVYANYGGYNYNYVVDGIVRCDNCGYEFLLSYGSPPYVLVNSSFPVGSYYNITAFSLLLNNPSTQNRGASYSITADVTFYTDHFLPQDNVSGHIKFLNGIIQNENHVVNINNNGGGYYTFSITSNVVLSDVSDLTSLQLYLTTPFVCGTGDSSCYPSSSLNVTNINIDLEVYSDKSEIIMNNINTNINITNEKLDDLNDTQNDIKDAINNTETTGASDTANSFFDNFQDNDFGLSSIITAPLRAINAMLSDTCVAPSATYKGQTFSFPCGSMLWNREGGEEFRNFINVIYGGFLAYFVIRSLFLDVEKLKNPNNDKVEVQKL